MLYSSGFFCFAIKNEGVWFDGFPLSNHRTDCRQGEPEFLRDVDSLLFQIFRSRFSAVKSQISCFLHFLLATVPIYTKSQVCRSAQNKRHDANGAVMKAGTGLSDEYS